MTLSKPAPFPVVGLSFAHVPRRVKTYYSTCGHTIWTVSKVPVKLAA